MTTQTERRVPEHPGWQPWWLRYAEYEGRSVVLVDVSRLPTPHLDHTGATAAYEVSEPVFRPCVICGSADMLIATCYRRTTDLAEAEAAFELACERLREGG